MWKKTLLAVAFLSASGLFAAEAAPADAKKEAEKPKTEAAKTETPSETAKIQVELKAKYPAEMEAIQKLAATDIMAALEQYRSLCRKANVRLPMPRFSRGEGGFGGRRGNMPSEGFGGGEDGERSFRGGFDRRGGMTPPDGFGGEEGERGDRSRRGGFGRRGGRGGFSGGGRSVEMAASIKTASSIKERFAEEYAALNKDLSAVEEKYETLAVKVGADTNAVTPMDRNLRKLETKKPAEFDAAAKLMKENMREGMIRLRELAEQEGIVLNISRRGGSGEGGETPTFSSSQTRVNPARQMKMIREKYPEEMKKFDELRRTDPAKAQELLRELNRRMNEGGNAMRQPVTPVISLNI